jgi:UDP-N-acetyl-2-amino-2-deoxyglucuronate dehydrogenase
MNYFAITGVAGYIAPRHLKAIKETGNELVAALDPHDSVGILDNFFPEAKYFNSYERFERYLVKLQYQSIEPNVEYLSICSPNYLHDTHIRLALNVDANAICEKPLVINPWNLLPLYELENKSGKRIYPVLQLRLHPSLITLREQLGASDDQKKMSVVVTYITSRGRWYQVSWKGDEEKSGGIAMNIGVHLFDILIWLFGKVETCEVHLAKVDKMAGALEMERASVRWFLSVDGNDLPQSSRMAGQRVLRSITVNGAEVNFSDGPTDLHKKLYENILNGSGWGIADAQPSIELVYLIRESATKSGHRNNHPLLLT